MSYSLVSIQQRLETETFINVNILYTYVNKRYTMLERLFTSKTRINALTLLMFNQEKDYHLREIARLIKVSPIYAAKELENLTKVNLVKKLKKGNLTLYSINKECRILSELRQIFIKTDYIGELIKKNLENKVRYAFIYGSFAKGEEKERSDIDLFIIGGLSEDELIKIIQNLEKKIDREINYILWNERTFYNRAKSHHLLKNIKKSKIIMLIGHENEFRRSIR